MMMEILQASRQFVEKYYPRSHLYVAGSVLGLAIALIVMPSDDTGSAPSNDAQQITIHIPLLCL